ncbi:NAD(P)H-dependent oxidoreductase subunit E [Alkalibaculum sp. M08DMB]|uniref:NAD(P)H-dependent oxidoreductase subunit E n=1 Tax=Alkalibaculum sporogenes TaxID=2655001 RepID=A0A6A7K5W3_9FIRM|nr:NAD(P)H-dependent oxidoreductase subunit E [Alkalibaculum sporogenes]MPW24533.1 NAD(P)H-dependent oxidoreductase subunit E [Alkalibaculum sporogenes]
MDFKFDIEKNMEKVRCLETFIEKNRQVPGVLIPVLQEAQGLFGYLAREVMEIIARGLDVPVSKVFGVATYYTQFTFMPKGENDISICLGTACYVKGAQEILEEVQNILGIKDGETTPDLKFSITSTRCVGDCSLAPVVLVNDDIYPNVNKKEVKDIIAKYKVEVECYDHL